MVFDLLFPSQGPRGRGLKYCAVARAIYVNNSHTKFGWISEKIIMTPKSHVSPKSHPWVMIQVTEWKSRLICLKFFICDKTHIVLFKPIWNWLWNWNVMIFDLFAPPQGPRRRDQKIVPLHVPFMWVTHTPNLVEFRKNNFLSPNPLV